MNSRRQHAPAWHKQVETRHVINTSKDSEWTAELINYRAWDEGTFAGVNHGFKYVLVVEDCFTRYAWTRALRNASAATCWVAFLDILGKCAVDGHRAPRILWTDDRREFKASFGEGLKAHSIELWHVHTDMKASMAMRLIRTLTAILRPILTQHQSHEWTKYLRQVTAIYNNRRHRILGMSPTEATHLDAVGQGKLAEHLFGSMSK
jgi:hypothetical protein